MIRRTKIVATIGPARRDEATLEKLVRAGMDVARLNFSHGDYAGHAQTIERVRALSKHHGRPVTILQDLQGPKIRTGKLSSAGVELKAGDSLNLTTEPIEGNQQRISIAFPDLAEVVSPGNRILLADGQLELLVRNIQAGEIKTEVRIGGLLRARQGVHLPGIRLNLTGFTEKDRRDLAFGLSHGVDVVAMSFIRSAEDVQRVREAIAELDAKRLDTPVIAKLERPEALNNLESIIRAADGVMVARGDMGIEMRPQEVPIAQKKIIEVANRCRKIVITATQMLESMIQNARPSRAEATDVANAIFDGTDAIMLSGETAVGRYPILAVEMMDAIACEAESYLDRWGHWEGRGEDPLSEDALYLARAGAELAYDRNVAAMAVFTRSGSTARLVSKTRPGVPILAYTTEERNYRRMAMYWGVIPQLVPRADTLEALIAQVDPALLAASPIERGQQVVLICGFPVDQMRPSNLILLHTVGQEL